jgi:predicted Zn-dependent protease
LGNLINAPIEGASQLVQANYSRQNENEADALGVQLASLAGYDPKTLALILTRINSSIEFLTGEKQKFSYFDSHPWTADRVKHINNASSSLTIANKPHLAKSSEEFLSKIDGIMISKDPAQGLFRDSLFLHPDLGFSIVFPSGWEYINNPSTVGATHPKGEAQIFLGIAGPTKDPSEYAKEFLKNVNGKKGMNITKDESIKVHNQDAHLVTITENTNKGPVSAHILWLNFGKSTYQFIGIGNKNNEEALKQTVLSFKPITASERESISIYVIRTVKVNKGETLSEINERSGNISNNTFLALINDLSADEKIKEDRTIKIIKREPYQ